MVQINLLFLPQDIYKWKLFTRLNKNANPIGFNEGSEVPSEEGINQGPEVDVEDEAIATDRDEEMLEGNNFLL